GDEVLLLVAPAETADEILISLKDSACRSDNKWERPSRQANGAPIMSSGGQRRLLTPTADDEQFDHLPSTAGDHGRGTRGRYTELPVPSDPPRPQLSQPRVLVHNGHTNH